MTRQEYYSKVEKALKSTTKLPINIELYSNFEWLPLNLYNYEIPVEAEYRLHFNIGITDFIINEKAFDKYYLPMISYNNKSEVEYRENDINITVNNLRYAILNEFQEYFLQPY